MKYFFLPLIMLISYNPNVIAMEAEEHIAPLRNPNNTIPLTPDERQFYKEQLVKLLEQPLEDSKKQTNIPGAPALIASAKLATPPTPEKPQSFFQENKKIIVVGGIGVSILAAGGIMWKLNSNNAIQKDYHIENAR